MTAFFSRHPLILAGGLCFLVLRVAWFLWFRSRSHRGRDSEIRSQLQAVLNHLRDGILVVDRERHVLFANAAAEPLLAGTEGRRRLDPAQGVYDLYYEDGRFMPPDEWPIARAFRGDFAQDVSVVLRHLDSGEVILREVSTSPFAIRGSDQPHVMVAFRDVTAARRVEEARTLLASIVESSDDAIIGKDLNGIIHSWNHGAERIFGYTAKEMIGRSILQLLPEGRKDEEESILQLLQQGETVNHFNTVRLTKDGRIIHVSLSISPIKDSAGKIIGASKIARDMTGFRNLEEQLRQSQKMEALGQLTGGIAHDFNNLLGIVLGSLELLKVEIQVEVPNREQGLVKIARTLEHAETARNAAVRGAELTRRLLAFSSSGSLHPVPTLLHESIQDMLALVSRALGSHIEVVTRLDRTIPAISIDPAALESALLNLVVNARDAMPENGRLSIALSLASAEVVTGLAHPGLPIAEAYACITVSDNGVGMTKETLARACDPFFTTKPRGQGTGLGLAMVYGFMKQSNGTLRIYSEPGYGTTVSLYLPILHQPVTLPEPPAVVPVPPGSTSAVLVVEDEPDLLAIAARYLHGQGYTVHGAADAHEALAMLEEHPEIDLMVSDIIMPGGMDGFELGRQVRATRPAIKVLYTSGFPSDALTQRPLLDPSDQVLQKPYQLAQLGAAVQAALAS